MLEIKNLSKTFDEKQVLSNINFTVNKNETVTYIGESGCGKTTTLRIICGLEKLDKGQVFLDGEDISKLEPKDRNISYVSQNYTLNRHMTVRENIGFCLFLKGKTDKYITKEVDKIAKTLEITDLLEQKPLKMSGGQQQRIAIAKAVLKKPKIFLMDEPLASLDPPTRFKLRKYLKEQMKNTICIYVTHDPLEALYLGKKVLVVKKQKVHFFDYADKLLKSNDKYIKDFIIEPLEHISGLLNENSN